MQIPLIYNLRNLWERKATTLMTALGIALTVGVLVTSMALIAGLRAAFSGTGNPLQAVVLRKGVTAELNSSVTEDAFGQIKLIPDIFRQREIPNESVSEPLASPELISIINLPSVDNPSGMNVTVRGLLPIGVSMRRVVVVQGRWFGQGRHEVVVGESVARRYKDATLGKRLHFGRGDWEVVGVFSGGHTAIDSEIWCDLNQLRSDFSRQGDMSSVLVRAENSAGLGRIIAAVKDNRQLNSTAVTEPEYYAQMMTSGLPLQVVGTFVATVMAIGSAFARHEHHVCRCCPARPGDRHASGDRVFARKHPDQFRDRVDRAGTSGWGDRLSVCTSAQQCDDWRRQFPDFQRDRFQFSRRAQRHPGGTFVRGMYRRDRRLFARAGGGTARYSCSVARGLIEHVC